MVKYDNQGCGVGVGIQAILGALESGVGVGEKFHKNHRLRLQHKIQFFFINYRMLLTIYVI